MNKRNSIYVELRVLALTFESRWADRKGDLPFGYKMSDKTSIVFVSGQWHTQFHTKPSMDLLQADGYKVIPCPLLSCGIKEPRPLFKDEVDNISSKIASEVQNGQHVCVVAHSAAGQPTVEAINKFLLSNAEKIEQVQLVFVASFLNGERALAKSGSRGWFHMDMENMTTRVTQSDTTFYNDMSAAESRPFVEALSPAIWWSDPAVVSGEDWKSVQKTYMLCLQDNAVFAEQQKEEIEDHGFSVVEIDAGHCPFVSQPEKFVATLSQILKS